MKYMLLLYESATYLKDASREQIQSDLEAHKAFTGWLEEQGIAVVHGEALRPPETAATVRSRDDELIVTDGPFTELKEQVAGFYILDCKDLEQAVEAARHCPVGTANEVRPVWEV